MFRRNRKQLREIVIKYVRDNPNVKVEKLEHDLKVNIHRLFGGIEKAYKAASVAYPRKRKSKDMIRRQVIQAIRNNELITADDMHKRMRINVYKHFKNLREAYKEAGKDFIPKHLKRRSRKIQMILNYIKSHPDAAQWEINKRCHCHVQEMFKGSIREAFALAGIKYPEERRKSYGSADKNIRKRAIDFENKIFTALKARGAKIHVRTTSGIADAVVKIGDEPFVIEVKDYVSKPISMTDVKQTLQYMYDLNIRCGVIICRNGRAKTFKKEDKKIFVISEADMNKLWGRSLVWSG